MSFVALVTKHSAGSATATLATAAFTTSGSNRHIDVHVGIRKSGGGGSITSAARTGETYVKQRQDDNPSGSAWHTAAFLTSTTQPVTGSQALTVTLGSSEQYWGFHVMVLDGVDQTTRIRGGTITRNPDGEAAVSSMNLSSVTGDQVVSSITGTAANPSTTPDGGTETVRGTWNTGSDHAWGAAATAPGAANVTLDWAGSLFRFVHYAVSHPPPADPPGQVTGLSAAAYSAERFTLTWTAPAGSPTGYKIEVSDNDADWDVHTADTASSATEAYPGGFGAEFTKYFRVSAINAEGTGTASDSVSATLPHHAGQEALSLLDFGDPFSVFLPPYGDGGFADADLQQALGFPIVPLLQVQEAPVARAGHDQTVQIFETATLDGSASFDPNGSALTYAWSLVSAPFGSTATLGSPTTVNPTLTPDIPGTYAIQLIVNDGVDDSTPDTVVITATPIPVADAGTDLTVTVGTLVTLDGSASLQATTFSWELLFAPDGSLAALSSTSISNPTFLPDIPGTYIIGLVVGDGASPELLSPQDFVSVTASELAAIAPMFVAASRPPTVPGNRRKAGVPTSAVELWKYPKDLYDVAVDWEEDDVLPAGATSLSTLTVAVKDSGGNDVTETLLADIGVEGFISWAQLQAGTAGQVYDVILTQLFNNGQRLDRYVKVQVRNPRSYVSHAPFKYPADKYPIPVEWAGRRPRGNPTLSTLITKAYDASDVDETSTYIAGSFVTGTIGAGYVIGGTGGESRLLEFAQEFSNGRTFHEYAMLTVEAPPA